MVNQYFSKEELYRMYPRKWVLISEPVLRERDGAVMGGEFVGVFDVRTDAKREAFNRNLRFYSAISSLQEED